MPNILSKKEWNDVKEHIKKKETYEAYVKRMKQGKPTKKFDMDNVMADINKITEQFHTVE